MASRVAVDISTEIGHRRAQDLINKQLRKPGGHTLGGPHGTCWLSATTTLLSSHSKSPSGHAQVWARKNSDIDNHRHPKEDHHHYRQPTKVAIPLAELSFLAFKGHPPHDSAVLICAEPACFNPKHVVDETAAVAESRAGCWGAVACPRHGLVILSCPHEPQCIRPAPPAGAVTCCLSQSGTRAQTTRTAKARARTAAVERGGEEGGPGAKRRRVGPADPAGEGSGAVRGSEGSGGDQGDLDDENDEDEPPRQLYHSFPPGAPVDDDDEEEEEEPVRRLYHSIPAGAPVEEESVSTPPTDE